MPSGLPISALLSQALVAFTIEFDNEFEHRTPHRTSLEGKTSRSVDLPWLVSMVMYAKFLRFVTEEGTAIRDMHCHTRLPAPELRHWLTRLSKWWNYITIHQASQKSPKFDWIVRPTPGGRKALEIWRPLTGAIEDRWRKRFGKNEIDALIINLKSVVDRFPPDLPSTLPILGFGLLSRPPQPSGNKSISADSYDRFLPALLSRVLYKFAIEFERDSDVSLAISANLLRVFDRGAITASELARLGCISKEAVAMSLTFLQKRGYVTAAKLGLKSRGKQIALTARGQQARQTYQTLTEAIESTWATAFGGEQIARLRNSLEFLTIDATSNGSPLFQGLTPYPNSWRASLPQPPGLPHFPMILHRGGFPDGS